MRKFLIPAILILLVLLIAGVGTLIILARERPFQPGDIFFPFQDLAEQVQAKITVGKTNRALYYLDLALQRTVDVEILANGEHALLAVEYLNRALDQAINAIVEPPQDDLVSLSSQLNDLLLRIDLALTNLIEIPPDQAGVVRALQAKVASLRSMLAEFKAIGVVGGDLSSAQATLNLSDRQGVGRDLETPGLTPYDILFPPGSPGALHLFYPLVGQHAELDCFACHFSGQYAGTSNLCSSCHREELPADHFPGDCADCHTPISWREVVFDHGLVDTTDCQSCHLAVNPPNHYGEQCSACHNTIDWRQAIFNHEAVGATDCLACHINSKPSNHFSGQCSLCHKTTSWTGATFNHAAYGAVDCKACHADERPANHYGGQCSTCHSTSSWRGASFNHVAAGPTDCKACHSGDKPGNHYSEQCSGCHNTSSWSGAEFDHGVAGATDCKACHSGDKPGNHYSGQCSACHSTSSWSGAKFDHDVAGATDCIACHSGDKPLNHFDGQCSQCHNTSSWSGAKFNHSFPINHGSANGVCSKCHPSGDSKWTCYQCHDKSETIKHHDEEGIADIGGRCLNCHPKGKEEDGDD